MQYCWFLIFVILLCKRIYTQKTQDISISYGFKSSTGDTNTTLECCFKSRNVTLTWNITEESQVMVYDNESYMVIHRNSFLLEDVAVFKFDTSNGSLIHISGNNNFTWRCGSSIPVNVCLNRNPRPTSSCTSTVPGESQMLTTDSTTDPEEVSPNTTKPMHASPKTDVYKIIIIVLSAFILVLLIIIIAILCHYKRKFNAKLQLGTSNKCVKCSRQQNHLEYVSLGSNDRTVELQNATRTNQQQTAQLDQSTTSCDSNQNNCANVHKVRASKQNRNKGDSYGPKFFPCQPEVPNQENIKVSVNTVSNETYSLFDEKNGNVTKTARDCKKQDNMKNNEFELQKLPKESPVSENDISISTDNQSDTENDETHVDSASDVQNNPPRKQKKWDHKESVRVVPGKNNPLVLLRSN